MTGTQRRKKKVSLDPLGHTHTTWVPYCYRPPQNPHEVAGYLTTLSLSFSLAGQAGSRTVSEKALEASAGQSRNNRQRSGLPGHQTKPRSHMRKSSKPRHSVAGDENPNGMAPSSRFVNLVGPSRDVVDPASLAGRNKNKVGRHRTLGKGQTARGVRHCSRHTHTQ